MSNPESFSDIDILRAIAERHANHPDVSVHLYAAANYLAMLQRGQQQPDEGFEVQVGAGNTCPMKWAVSVKSVAAGSDMKEATCGRPASEPVEYQGVLYVVCPQCKDELVNMGGLARGETA